MPKIVNLDFSAAPPRQGGGGITFVPPGPYVLRVTDADTGESTAGNPQFIVTFEINEGEHFGDELKDYFSPCPPRKGDKMNGAQKFHALLIALGFKQQKGPVKLDLEKLIGRKCTANIGTEQMQATAQYPNARDASKIKSYELPTGVTSPAGGEPEAPVASSNGAAPVAKAAVAVAAPVAAAAAEEAPPPDDEPVQEVVDGDEDPFA